MKNVCFLLLFICNWCVLHAQVIESERELKINPNTLTIQTRFAAPKGYDWESFHEDTFQNYLVNFPLKPENFPIRNYKDVPISKQYHHEAILDIDVGNKDLQQCADAWIRLYSEYLWKEKRFDEIDFEFTSGQKLSWNQYKNGLRTTEVGDSVKFHQSSKYEDGYSNFRRYLDLVFQYAGTISLDRESEGINKNSEIQVGDIIIKPGSPGHAVFIVGSAKNKYGKRLFLLAESYMPAQDIHVIKNPNSSQIFPWYELDVRSSQLITAKYIFRPVSIKRFKGLK